MCMYIETECFFKILLIEYNQKAWVGLGWGGRAGDHCPRKEEILLWKYFPGVIVLSLLNVSPQLLFMTL